MNHTIPSIAASAFEIEVASFILDNCRGNETLNPYLFSMGKNRYFTADGYLPEGCKDLKLPSKTIIEVKRKVLSDTIYQWIRNIQNTFDKDSLYHFVLIHDSKKIRDDWKINIKGYDIEIISIEDLKDRAPKSDTIEKEATLSWAEKSKKLEELSKEKEATQDEIFQSLQKIASTQGSITLFLGAGVSVSGGLPSWNVLLENLVNEINPDSSPSILAKGHIEDIKKASNWSSIIMARYMRAGKDHPLEYKASASNGFNQALHRALYSNLKTYNQQPLINSIASLISAKIAKSVITYNFDDYLESTLDIIKIPYQSIGNGERLRGGDFPIYHVHGFMPIDQNNTYIPNPVLTEESYHKLYQDAYQWSNVEQLHALNNSTCIFIGLSMTDPNIRRLMEISMMRNESDNKIAPHYVFLRREKFHEDMPNHINDSSTAQDEENRKIIEKVLHELGANVIWYDNHDEVPKRLDSLIQSGVTSQID